MTKASTNAKLLKFLSVAALALLGSATLSAKTIKVGSKHFNESYILAEIMSQLLEAHGFDVERNFALGGTLICYQALINAEIDIYPEYSGTIEQAILKLDARLSFAELQKHIADSLGLQLPDSFGFDNTYALAVGAKTAERLRLTSISDLKGHPNLKYGFSYEYIERGDGWRALARAYQLNATPTGMEHSLAYQALNEGKIDVIDVYSTDAEIKRYDLTLLEDDKDFFPVYLAAPLIRASLDDNVKSVLALLTGTIDEETMQSLNAEVLVDGKSFSEVAHVFLSANGLTERRSFANNRWVELADRTLVHLALTLSALFAAILFAVPFGVFIYRNPAVAQPVIYMTGLLQTVPSLALLALMIPLFGIGTTPALVALFLYALLPILRNTYSALVAIDPVLKQVAVGIGLTVWQQLRHIELPLALQNMLAGIRTAAIILVGTATIAAFIGAGGLGEYIVTGLSLNDPVLILWGAIPAALLAIAVELLFEALERSLIPRHLRVSS
jgi:osmoprotectant transport system permease protein